VVQDMTERISEFGGCYGTETNVENARVIRISPVPVAARSTDASLQRSWVRIPPGAWMSVCYVCCQREVSATS
jgi:hypothetical protein